MADEYRKVEAEVVSDRDARATSADLAHLRDVARVMDDLFELPVIGYRIGLDGVIGLIPGLGDFIGLLVSGYFVIVAARMDLPRSVLARMVLNIVIEATLGSIPFLGDLFDFVWKSNAKNMALLERAVTDPRRTGRRSLGLLLAFSAVFVGILILLVWVIIATLSWFFDLIATALHW